MPELITRRKFLTYVGVVLGALGLADIGVNINKYLQAERENARLIQSLLAATQLTPTTDRKALAKLGFHAQFEIPEMGENLDFGTWHGPKGPLEIKTNSMGEFPMPQGYGSKYPNFPSPNPIEKYATENKPVKVYTYGSLGTADRINQPELFALLSRIFSTIPTTIPGEIHINCISSALDTGRIYRTSNPTVYAPGIALVSRRFQAVGPDFAASNIVVHPNQPTLIGFQVFLNLDMLHKYALETGLTYEQACWLAIANEFANIWACTPNPRMAQSLGRQNGAEAWSTGMGWLAALAPKYRSAIFGQVDIKDLQDGVDLLAEEMSILAKLN